MRIFLIVVIVIVGIGAGVVGYRIWIAGPHLSVRPQGVGVRIEGRLFGEYNLGFKRVRITDSEMGIVSCEWVGDVSADLDLRPGANTTATMFSFDKSHAAPLPASDCQLERGRTYRVTVWGNNGFALIRKSSVDVHF
jgi:hypothetical protein